VGCWAIRDSGRSKSKSLSVNSRVLEDMRCLRPYEARSKFNQTSG
jgi:hypothetical protein